MKKTVSVILAIVMIVSVSAFHTVALADEQHSVDFGSASWTVDGVVVTATMEDKDLTAGAVTVYDFDAIKLTGFDGGKMSVRVYAPDGFSAELEPNGDNEVSLGRPVDKNLVIPPEVRFEVEPGQGGDPGEGPGEGPGEEPGDRKFTVDFGTAKWTVNGVEVTAVSWGLDLTQGAVELEARDAIRINGLDSATMQVRVYAEDGFSAELEPNGDNEVSLGRPADENVHLPDTLRFVVEPKQGDASGELRVHVSDNILQMTPEELGASPEEFEMAVKQIRRNLSNYDKLFGVFEIRAERDGEEVHGESFEIRLDMTDALLGYEGFQLVRLNEDGLTAQETVALGQAEGKLVCELSQSGLYALVGDEIQSDVLLGDVDSNGKIEAADARLALRIAVGLEPEMGKGTPAYEAANVTEMEKGEVNAADARLILRRAVGFEDPEYGV
ncbi:MAG: hypothetical protein IJT27_05875 [Clostridia bacterium]|nr:hypothetical protein [Clostridia bacterium]